MKYLFYDTETTGLPDFKQPVIHDCQPHVVQLAAILTDAEGNEMSCMNVIIDNGVVIPDRAAEVHGITTDIATEFGVTLAHALSMFTVLVRKTDKIVAHNINFDNFVMKANYHRAIISYSKKPVKELEKLEKEAICTLQMAKPIMQLPPTAKMKAAGMTDFKNPNLTECVKHFLNEDLEGAHDALVDVRACKRVFFEMYNNQDQC